MIDIAINLSIGVAVLFSAYIVWLIGYNFYKEKEWRRNNPNEWIHKEGIRRGFYKKPKDD